MHFNMAVLPIFILLVIGTLSMFMVMRLLSKEVSRDKLDKVDDLSVLWKVSFPPNEVLTERGLKIQNWYRIFVIILIVGAGLLGLLVTGFSNSPITII